MFNIVCCVAFSSVPGRGVPVLQLALHSRAPLLQRLRQLRRWVRRVPPQLCRHCRCGHRRCHRRHHHRSDRRRGLVPSPAAPSTGEGIRMMTLTSGTVLFFDRRIPLEILKKNTEVGIYSRRIVDYYGENPTSTTMGKTPLVLLLFFFYSDLRGIFFSSSWISIKRSFGYQFA